MLHCLSDEVGNVSLKVLTFVKMQVLTCSSLFQLNKTFSWSYGGFQGARGAPDGKEWYVENIFEELDVPGEWFLDYDTMKLYYFPSGAPPKQVYI